MKKHYNVFSYEDIALINSLPHQYSLIIDLDILISEERYMRRIIENQISIFLSRITGLSTEHIDTVIIADECADKEIEDVVYHNCFSKLNRELKLTYEQKVEIYSKNINFPNIHKIENRLFLELSKYVNIVILSQYPVGITLSFLKKFCIFECCSVVLVPDPTLSVFKEEIDNEIIQMLVRKLKSNATFYFSDKKEYVFFGKTPLRLNYEIVKNSKFLQDKLKRILLAYNISVM